MVYAVKRGGQVRDFHRILCQKLGKEVENGEIPSDMKWLGQIVEDISYNNAKRYFGF